MDILNRHYFDGPKTIVATLIIVTTIKKISNIDLQKKTTNPINIQKL